MKPKNILVIDFEDHSIKSIKDLLESNEYNVMVAHDGIEGYEKFQSFKPDLIIMEPMLPKLHGFDLRKRIARESQKDIPFIVITKFYREEQFKEDTADSFAADAFLKKPADQGTLLNIIEELFPTEPEIEITEPPPPPKPPSPPPQPKSKPKTRLFDDDIEKKLSEALSFTKKTSSPRSSQGEIDKKIEDLLKIRLSDIKSDPFLKKPKVADTKKLDDYDITRKEKHEVKPSTEEIKSREKPEPEKPLITGADLLPDEEEEPIEKEETVSEEPAIYVEEAIDQNNLSEEAEFHEELKDEPIKSEQELPGTDSNNDKISFGDEEDPTVNEKDNIGDIPKEMLEGMEEEDYSQEFEEALEDDKEEEKDAPDLDEESKQIEEQEMEDTAEPTETRGELDESDKKIEKDLDEDKSQDEIEAYETPEPEREHESIEADENLKAEIFDEEKGEEKTEIYEKLIEEPYEPEQDKEYDDEDTYLGIKVGKKKKVKKTKPAAKKSNNKGLILSLAFLTILLVSVFSYFFIIKNQGEKTPPPPPNGFLVIQPQEGIDYEGLQIFKDSETVPLNLSETYEIPVGSHQVRFEKNEKIFVQNIQILEETTEELQIPLFPVTINISPRGEIWDGENKVAESASTHTLFQLPVDYTYTFKQAGYQDVTEIIRITENNLTEPVEIELPRIIPVEPGTLEVQVFPSGQVFEGNQLLATFPPIRQNITLSPGSHSLRYTSTEEGCDDQIKTYQIRSGEILAETIFLCFGFINVNTNPPGALIMIDNRETDFNGNLYGQTPRANLRLPVGPHMLTLNHPDFPQKTLQIVIQKNETINRSVNLNEQNY